MKIARIVLMVALVTGGVSCRYRPVETTMAGSWRLDAVDGKRMPIVLAPAPDPKIIREGLLLIYPDGVYTYDHWIEIREGQRVRAAGASAEGTWERDGDDIYLTDKATGAANFGTVYGTALKVVFGKEIHAFELVVLDPTVWQKGGT
jgi:hypothetical protein